MYCTELPPTVIVVAALFWTTAATRASARELRLIDVRSEHYLPVQTLCPMARAMAEQHSLTHQISMIAARRDHFRRQIEATGLFVVKEDDRKPFQAAMAGVHRQAAIDPAAAVLIARMRQVE